MRVIELKAENLKRLKAIEIRPEGDMVVISGRNAAGKSSCLDALWMALAGGAAAKDTTAPVRQGEDHAEVRVDLGDFVVTRTWNAEGKSTLKVTNAEGARYPSPQTMLDELVGRLTFDPLAFSRQGDREQVSTLLDLIDLPFDPAELATRRASVYEQRREDRRELKAAPSQLAALPEPPPGLPDAEVSVTEVLTRRDAAEQHNREIAQVLAASAQADATYQEAELMVAALEEQLFEARKHAQAMKSERTLCSLAARSVPEPADLSAFRDEMEQLELTNAQIRQAAARRGISQQVTRLDAQVSDYTSQIEAMDNERVDALAQADMPIEGLSFSDAGVTYNGVPFAQCSSAEQLRVSVAMAMAANPKLRVLRVTDGSLLDGDNMALLAEMVAEHDYQVWIERIESDEFTSVVIEDGSVVARAGDA